MFVSNGNPTFRVYGDFFWISTFSEELFLQSNQFNIAVTFSKQLLLQLVAFFKQLFSQSTCFFSAVIFFRIATYSELNFYRGATSQNKQFLRAANFLEQLLSRKTSYLQKDYIFEADTSKEHQNFYQQLHFHLFIYLFIYSFILFKSLFTVRIQKQPKLINSNKKYISTVEIA